MNEEFHYYIVAFLARRAGFSADEAYVLAYSSQYTDHALVAYRVRGQGVEYDTIATHHFGFWDSSQTYTVWLPFHFVPGDPDKAASIRQDGRKNALVVTENGPRAKELLIAALKSGNLMRIGIALHTFADTWAHQNFTGRNEPFNRIESRSPVPPIGHAHAGRAPDRIEHTWEDPRLVPEARQISNRERFFAAARKIYRYLCTFNRRDFSDEGLVLSELESLLGPAGQERPFEERKLDYIIREDIPEYRRNDWKGEAIELDDATGDEDVSNMMDKYLWLKHELTNRAGVTQKTVTPKPGFFHSRYYQWHEAAREHKNEARKVLRDLRLPGL